LYIVALRTGKSLEGTDAERDTNRIPEVRNNKKNLGHG